MARRATGAESVSRCASALGVRVDLKVIGDRKHRCFNNKLMETKILKIEDMYVPVKGRKPLNPKVVNKLAESMLVRG